MKRRWWNFISLAAVAVLLYFLLKRIDFVEVYLVLTYAKPVFIALAFLCTGMTFIFWTIRWTNFFGSVFKGEFWFLFKVLLAGSFFNAITPGAGVGGEPFRAHFLAKRYKQPRTKMLGYVFGDKFFQLMYLGIFGVFSIFFVFVYVDISNQLKYILEAVLFVVLGLIGIGIYLILKKKHGDIGFLLKKFHFFDFIKKKFKTQEEFEKFVNLHFKAFTRVFKRVVKKKKNFILGSILAFAHWILIYLTSYFIFLAFKLDVNFLSVVVVVTLATLFGDLSMIPSGIGVTEISMTLLYAAMGIDVAFALVISIIARLIYYIYSIPIGAICLWNVRKITRYKR